MKEKQKYISRYEKEKGGSYTFCGWRLCITRCKVRYVRYFSDKVYQTPEAGLAEALEERERILAELKQVQSGDVAEYFRQRRRLDYEKQLEKR